MKNEATIPEHFPVPNEENLRAAAKRREAYSLARDQKAKEDNEAIVKRIEREKGQQS